MLLSISSLLELEVAVSIHVYLNHSVSFARHVESFCMLSICPSGLLDLEVAVCVSLYLQGMACLHWACSKGHLDAVKLLVENNAFPNHMEFREDRCVHLCES